MARIPLTPGLVVLAVVMLVALVAAARTVWAAYHLLRYRWGRARDRTASRWGALRRVLPSVGVFVALVVAVAAVVGLAPPLNLAVAAVVVTATVVATPPLVVAALGTRTPTPAEQDVIDRTLSPAWRETAGVTVRVLPAHADQRPNGFATGILPGWRYILVPAVVFDELDAPELAALLAHERGHLAERHTLVRTAALPGLVALVAGVVLWRPDVPAADLALPVGVFGYLAGMTWLARRMEYRADAYAARLLDDPEPVISVLETLEAIRSEAAPEADAEDADVGDVDDEEDSDWADWLIVHHPPTAKRTDRLANLE